MDLIQQVLDTTAESESPTSFYRWSTLAAISAVCRNNVRVSIMGGMIVFRPNIYVILLADSGVRKGAPIKLAQEMVEECDVTRVISGRSSIQAIIAELSKTKTTANGGPPNLDANGFVVNDEFSASLVHDPDGLTILNNLYDHHKVWKNMLKHSGTETLKNPYITMLGGINPPLFSSMMEQKDIEGGFIARCLLIVEKERSKINSGRRAVKAFDTAPLIARLKEISHIKGDMTITDKAWDLFESWYNDWKPERMKDKTGTAKRIHAQIWKVSTLISLARRSDLVIDEEEMQTSMDWCLGLLSNSSLATGGAGKSAMAGQTMMVMKSLIDAEGYRLSRRKILRRHWEDMNSVDLDSIVQTLDQAGFLTQSQDGGEIIYAVRPEQVEKYKSYKQEE